MLHECHDTVLMIKSEAITIFELTDGFIDSRSNRDFKQVYSDIFVFVFKEVQTNLLKAHHGYEISSEVRYKLHKGT